MSSDLIGGIKNAQERKEPMDKIRQSFINAGYSPQEVDTALKEITGIPIQMIPIPSAQNTGIKEQNQFPALPQAPITEEKKSNALVYIIVGVVCLLVLIGSAILGLFWDKIFK
jgi:hypothetical protein